MSRDYLVNIALKRDITHVGSWKKTRMFAMHDYFKIIEKNPKKKQNSLNNS